MGFSRVLALPLREAMKHPEFIALMERFIPKGFSWIMPLMSAEVALLLWDRASHWLGERKNAVDAKQGVKALEIAKQMGKRLDATDKTLEKMDAKFLEMMTKLDETNKLLAAQKDKLGTVEIGKTTPKPAKVGVNVDIAPLAV